MKKNYLYIPYLFTAILGFATSPVYSQQNVRPVGMQYVGSQQYIGQTQQIVPTQQLQPTINSIYATPMQRVNEIPLYGKNKSMYFYNQQKQKDGLFADGGLYMFGAFSTGKTTGGINAENPNNNFFNGIGSTANSDMGDPTGITFGFGRTMSSDLNLELMYTKYTGMKYGDYVRSEYTENDEDNPDCEDEDGNNICPPITVISDDYEVVSGGKISSDFFGIGFQYKLDHTFGALLGGMLKPYIGIQIGYAMNNIDDYKIEDPDGYSAGDPMYKESEETDENGNPIEEPNQDCADTTGKGDSYCTQINYYDGEITYLGKNNKSFGYGLEAGFTIALENNMEIDFFYKRKTLGKVTTSGTVISSYYKSETTFYEGEFGQASDCAKDEDYNGDWCYYTEDAGVEEGVTNRNAESGDLNINEFGMKIKYMF